MQNRDPLQAPQALLEAQKLAKLYDEAVTIPLIGIKLGLDFLLGLIPIVGDIAMVFLSLRIIQLGKRIGMPKYLLVKMTANAVFDGIIGFVPIVGDLIDIFYTANKKNVRIMEQWWISNNKSAVDAYTQKQLEEWTKTHESPNT